MSLDVGTVKGEISIDDKFSSAFALFQTGSAQITRALSDLVAKLDSLRAPTTHVKSDTDLAAEAQRRAAAETNAATEAYRRLAGQLNPTIAGTNKYENAHRTLDTALAHGVITHHQYESALDKAKEKFLSAGGGLTQFNSLLGKLTDLAAQAGPAAKEAAEKLGSLGEKASSVSELVESLGPLAPLLVAVAAAVAVVGVAWKTFELTFDFLKDAIKEGASFEQTVAKLNNTLIANGAAAGLSAHEIVEFAEKMSYASAQPTEAILKGVTVLTQFQKIGHETFERATKDILDYAAQTGKAPEEAFEKFGRALEGGQRGLRALEEVGGVFLQGQKATLRQMLDNGEVTKYQTTLLKILEEHVHGAAAAYAQTFNGQVAQASNALKDFKESIASEVLPALEDIIASLVSSSGGWAGIRKQVSGLGHELGNFLRETAYHIAEWYHKNVSAQDDMVAGIRIGFKTIIDLAFDFAEALLKIESKLPGWAGGSAADKQLKWIRDFRSNLDASMQASIDANIKGSVAHAGALAVLIKAENEHRQALAGSDEVEKKHKSTIDSVANAAKNHKSILDSVAATIRDYTEKVADLNAKLDEQANIESGLLASLDHGLAAYDSERLAQAQTAAATSAVTTLYKDQRSEIDKLTDDYHKLVEAHNHTDAARVLKEIDDSNAAYLAQSYILGVKAAADVADKQTENIKSGVLRANVDYTNKYSTAIAQLTDAITGNHDATRENAIQLETQSRFLAQLTPAIHANADAEQALHDKIENEVRSRHNQINAINDATTAIGKFNSLANQADFQVAVSRIDSNASAGFRDLEEKYLSFITDGGNRSVEQARRFLEQIATAAGTTVEKVTDGIRSSLQDLLDASKAAGVRGSSKTVLDRYLEERADIERLMTASTGRVHITVADGLAKLEQLHREFIANQLSHLSSALGVLSQEFGGVFTKLLRAVQVFQEVQQLTADFSALLSAFTTTAAPALVGSATSLDASAVALEAAAAALDASAGASSAGSGVSAIGGAGGAVAGGGTGAGAGGIGGANGLLSGSGSAGAGGAIAAWVAIEVVFALLVNSLNAHLQKTKEELITLGDTLNVKTGTGGSTSRIAALIAAGQALANDVKSFFAGYGGIFDTLNADIGIKHRGQGSNSQWKVYVNGVVTNFGKDQEAALNYALIEAIRNSTTIGLDPLVVAAIKDYTGKSIDEFKKAIDFAQKLATQNLTGAGASVNAAITQYFTDINQAKTQFIDDSTGLNLALASISQKFSSTVGALRNSILGIDTSGTDFLQGIVDFQNQLAKVGDISKAQIRELIAGVQAQIDALVRPKLTRGEGADAFATAEKEWQDAVNVLRRQIEQYTSELNKIPEALSKQQIAGAVFGELFDKYIKGTSLASKYASQELEFQKAKLAAVFEEYKVQILALGLWDKYAGLWEDAYNQALRALGAVPTSHNTGDGTQHQLPGTGLTKPDKTGAGSGSGSGSRATGQTPAEQLAAFFAAFDRGQLPQLAQQIYDVNKKYDDEIKLAGKNTAAIAKLNSERDIEIDKLREAARASAISNVNSFLGINGPQITQQIVGVNRSADDLIASLRELNRAGVLSTAELHSLVPAIRAAAVAQISAIKSGVQAQIDAFANTISNQGLTGALAAIDTQAATLRKSLNELAAAGSLTADEFFKDAAKIIAASDAQKQSTVTSAANSLLSSLYGYLKDDKAAAQLKYTLAVAELEVQRNQLALAGYNAAALAVIDGLIAKVVTGGPALFESGGSSAATGPNPANALTDAANQQSNASNDLQSAADALRSAVQALNDYGKSLITNSSLSALTPADQLSEAKRQLLADYDRAKAGDTSAVSAYQALANTFLQLSKSQDISNASYGADFQLVLDEINSISRLTGLTPLPSPGVIGQPGNTTNTSGLGGIGSPSSSSFSINLDPVVRSVSSASDRNHEDLSTVAARVSTLTLAVQAQQSTLDRIVGNIGVGGPH